ncbi:glyoxylate/hydroxypyruvate reductase A [Halomonas alkaliantarctica]|nr:glyoxylate/hydroxypyruvate reductase A [Halomonas alkaliantarctica]
MKIVVHIKGEAEQWREALADAFPEATVLTSDASAEERKNADYLAVWKPPEELLREQTQLKAMINLGAGVDYLLRTPGRPKEVPIAKLRDAGMSELMADYVLYGVLHFYRSFDRYAAQQANAQWQPHPVEEKSQWPVGVLGLGAIGAHVAETLSQAGFPVSGWSRSPKRIEGVNCLHGDDGLENILSQAKTLITLLPDTTETRGIINAKRLGQLPQGASLINPGRGTLVDENALLKTLDASEGLRGAMLDVFPEEPLPADNPLWRHPKVTITPHMSAPTPLHDAIDQVIAYIRDFEAGKSVTTVDPENGY